MSSMSMMFDKRLVQDKWFGIYVLLYYIVIYQIDLEYLDHQFQYIQDLM